MRAGSNASASRFRLDCTPSIHIVSELTWKNGCRPSSGKRLDHAAAGAEHLVALVGNDDVRRFARGHMVDDLVAADNAH